MLKGIRTGLNILTRKNKGWYVSLSIFLYDILYLFFQRPSNSNNNESLFLLSDGLWKVKTKYMVLCLNASANF